MESDWMVTGSRKGWFPAQRETFMKVGLWYIQDLNLDRHHNGLARGVDTQVMIVLAGAPIDGYRIGHPSTHGPNAMALQLCHEVRVPEEPLVRNVTMINESSFAIALPHEFKELKRGSGTWAGIRYARKVEKSLLIIWPDGTYDRENL